MERLAKTLVGTMAAGSMAVSAAPALARDGNGIGAGEVIAGALVIGGIAAIAAAASNNDRGRYNYDSRYRYDDRRYRGSRYRGYNDNPRLAVEQCVRAVERSASRYGYGRANVTQIRKVKRTGKGFDIKGNLVVDDRGYSRYRGSRGYDSGRFD